MMWPMKITMFLLEIHETLFRGKGVRCCPYILLYTVPVMSNRMHRLLVEMCKNPVSRRCITITSAGFMALSHIKFHGICAPPPL